MPRKKPTLTPDPPKSTDEPDRTQTPETRGYQEIALMFDIMRGEGKHASVIQLWIDRGKLSAMKELKGRNAYSKGHAAGRIKAFIHYEHVLQEV